MTNAFKVLPIVLAVIFMLAVAGCGEHRVVPQRHWYSLGADAADTGSMLGWLMAVGILGIGASLAAAIWLPSKELKSLAAAIGTGFGAILGIALLVKGALPFLPWVSLALLACGLAIGLMRFRKYIFGMQAAVGFGNAIEAAVTDDDVQAIKKEHAEKQKAMGVKPIIEATLKKLKGKA